MFGEGSLVCLWHISSELPASGAPLPLLLAMGIRGVLMGQGPVRERGRVPSCDRRIWSYVGGPRESAISPTSNSMGFPAMIFGLCFIGRMDTFTMLIASLALSISGTGRRS